MLTSSIPSRLTLSCNHSSWLVFSCNRTPSLTYNNQINKLWSKSFSVQNNLNSAYLKRTCITWSISEVFSQWLKKGTKVRESIKSSHNTQTNSNSWSMYQCWYHSINQNILRKKNYYTSYLWAQIFSFFQCRFEILSVIVILRGVL